jgi:hypothetical protein
MAVFYRSSRITPIPQPARHAFSVEATAAAEVHGTPVLGGLKHRYRAVA